MEGKRYIQRQKYELQTSKFTDIRHIYVNAMDIERDIQIQTQLDIDKRYIWRVRNKYQIIQIDMYID